MLCPSVSRFVSDRALNKQVASRKAVTSAAAGAAPKLSAFSNRHAAKSGAKRFSGKLARIRSFSTRRRLCPQRRLLVESMSNMASLLGTLCPPVIARRPFLAPPATLPAAFFAMEKPNTSTGFERPLFHVAGVLGDGGSCDGGSRGEPISGDSFESFWYAPSAWWASPPTCATMRLRFEIHCSLSAESAQQKTNTRRNVWTWEHCWLALFRLRAFQAATPPSSHKVLSVRPL